MYTSHSAASSMARIAAAFTELLGVILHLNGAGWLEHGNEQERNTEERNGNLQYVSSDIINFGFNRVSGGVYGLRDIERPQDLCKGKQ